MVDSAGSSGCNGSGLGGRRLFGDFGTRLSEQVVSGDLFVCTYDSFVDFSMYLICICTMCLGFVVSLCGASCLWSSSSDAPCECQEPASLTRTRTTRPPPISMEGPPSLNSTQGGAEPPTTPSAAACSSTRSSVSGTHTGLPHLASGAVALATNTSQDAGDPSRARGAVATRSAHSH